MTRRASIIMPFAFGGLIAVSTRKELELPDAARDGSGGEITIVLYSNSGESEGAARVKKLVKTETEWRKQLFAEEFAVTRLRSTERAYTGRYWNNREAGLYRCVCCGNALFRSREKFDSGTGWPSFRAPAAEENIRKQRDTSLFVERVEVRCRKCDAHLGHVSTTAPRLPVCDIASTRPP